MWSTIKRVVYLLLLFVAGRLLYLGGVWLTENVSFFNEFNRNLPLGFPWILVIVGVLWLMWITWPSSTPRPVASRPSTNAVGRRAIGLLLTLSLLALIGFSGWVWWNKYDGEAWFRRQKAAFLEEWNKKPPPPFKATYYTYCWKKTPSAACKITRKATITAWQHGLPEFNFGKSKIRNNAGTWQVNGGRGWKTVRSYEKKGDGTFGGTISTHGSLFKLCPPDKKDLCS